MDQSQEDRIVRRITAKCGKVDRTGLYLIVLLCLMESCNNKRDLGRIKRHLGVTATQEVAPQD